MEKVKITAPAKINLSLEIKGRRADGMHIIDTVMQTVTLAEEITVERTKSGVTISPGTPFAPADGRNTARKAAERFLSFTGLAGNAGVHIEIKKNVPVRAGLGGGSADAAGVLRGLDLLFSTGLGDGRLEAVARQVGSDVPFLLKGGTGRAVGTGRTVTDCPPLPDCFIAICMPEKGISTPEAYRAYDRLKVKPSTDTRRLVKAMEKRNLGGICRQISNDLEIAANLREIPLIKKTLLENGAMAARMTGSGAAVFGIFRREEEGKKALEKVKKLCPFRFLCRPRRSGPTRKFL